MKRNYFKKAILAIALCAALLIPTLHEVNAKTDHIELIRITETSRMHWAQRYVNDLIEKYDLAEYFQGKNFNDPIQGEDFVKLVQLTLDSEYSRKIDAITREAVVYEAATIWAEKTNQKLDDIAIIKMIIYSDTTDIDAKYMHGVYVAYTKNIAKGKGNVLFDPKAEITYGEIATLICNVDAAIKKELAGIEPIMKGRYETRGSYQVQEGKVVFDFELMSHYAKETSLMFHSGQSFDLVITDEAGNEVYRFADGRMFTQAIREVKIGAGEALKYQDVWDMTNKDGVKLIEGNYNAVIRIMASPLEVVDKDVAEQFKLELDFSLGK